MAYHKQYISVLVPLLIATLVFEQATATILKLGFYRETCPYLNRIVKETVSDFVSQNPGNAPALLRLHFHDCFVRGCDGSVLIDSTENGQPPEKSAPPNLSLEGFDIIDVVKAAVEKACPGIVSCADILALAARDAIYQIKGPFWPVFLGRRDGRVSLASEALTNLPSPTFNITQLKALFASKDLDIKDLVVLSGAHTIGDAHCSSFSNRLYNFTGIGDTDPSLDPAYIQILKAKCQPNDAVTNVGMDPGSELIFDEDYYTLVAGNRGLFQSDAALLNDNFTGAYVKLRTITNGHIFFDDFEESMIKMGRIGVLTGNEGEIRETCAVIL